MPNAGLEDPVVGEPGPAVVVEIRVAQIAVAVQVRVVLIRIGVEETVVEGIVDAVLVLVGTLRVIELGGAAGIKQASRLTRIPVVVDLVRALRTREADQLGAVLREIGDAR